MDAAERAVWWFSLAIFFIALGLGFAELGRRDLKRAKEEAIERCPELDPRRTSRPLNC